MNKYKSVLIVVLACLTTACGSNQPAASTSQPETNPSQATASGEIMTVATELPVLTVEAAVPPTVPATPADQATPTASGRDFTKIDVCSLITDKEVARLDNGSVQSPAQNSDLGPSRGCSYGIQTADGGYDNVIIYVEPADLLEASMELSTDQATAVAGLGDQAFLQNDVDAEQFRLLAERKGDFGIEVIGENEDALVAIAHLLFERIQ